DLAGLPRGAVVLTGSARRHALVLEERPDLRVLPLRGNLDTRLRRWRSSGAAGVILAAAGLSRLDRLGAGGLPAHELPPARFLPAVGQGTLVLQGLGDAAPALLAGSVDDPQARASGEAERWLADRAGADCHDAFAAWVRPQPTGGWRASAWRAAS